jgi:hypothetical protein
MKRTKLIRKFQTAFRFRQLALRKSNAFDTKQLDNKLIKLTGPAVPMGWRPMICKIKLRGCWDWNGKRFEPLNINFTHIGIYRIVKKLKYIQNLKETSQFLINRSRRFVEYAYSIYYAILSGGFCSRKPGRK